MNVLLRYAALCLLALPAAARGSDAADRKAAHPERPLAEVKEPVVKEPPPEASPSAGLVEVEVKKGGILLRFPWSLSTQTAADAGNWRVERWPLRASKNSASSDRSPQSRTGSAEKSQREAVTVTAIYIGTDDRSVFLEIPDLKPVMQMSIRYRIKTAEGKPLHGEVVNTIHALGDEE